MGGTSKRRTKCISVQRAQVDQSTRGRTSRKAEKRLVNVKIYGDLDGRNKKEGCNNINPHQSPVKFEGMSLK